MCVDDVRPSLSVVFLSVTELNTESVTDTLLVIEFIVY